jgi:hypothetical protein
MTRRAKILNGAILVVVAVWLALVAIPAMMR